MSSLKFLQLDKFQYCSMVSKIPYCIPNSDGISNENNLLSKPALRYSVWFISIFTLVTNISVIWGRGRCRDENRSLSLLIRNLAVADGLMGVYLLTIAIQDFRFSGQYVHFSRQWTTSSLCISIGAIAMISSEVSMLILTFMSVERFLLIVNPLGGYAHLNLYTAQKILFILWSIGLTLSILPIIHWRNNNYFYGIYNGMCFPLHLHEKFPIGWQYSTFIILGVNLSGILVITTVYIGMFLSICNTRKAVQTSVTECEFAVRFFFIVLTNASCWIPIICLKILIFFDIEISADVYGWLVVFILPLNSAVNPILYTFTTSKYRNHIVSKKWKTSKNYFPKGDTESSRTSSNKNITYIDGNGIKYTINEIPKTQSNAFELHTFANITSSSSSNGAI